MDPEECPCCLAPMNGSDHCPLCGCEAHQTTSAAHLKEHVRKLMRKLSAIRDLAQPPEM